MIFVESIENMRALTLLNVYGKSYFISQHGPLFVVEPENDHFSVEELVHPLGEDLYIIESLDMPRLVKYNSRHRDYVLIGSRIGPVYGQQFNKLVTRTFNCHEQIWGSCLYCPKRLIYPEQFSPSIMLPQS